MLTKVFSANLIGLDCQLVDVEIDFRRGNYAFHIVGLADKSVQESKERVVSAIKNCGFTYTPMVTIANLAPAEIPKTGTHFDFPIAVGYISSSGQLDCDFTNKLFIGELGLDGSIKPVKGILPIVDFAKRTGISQIFLPYENAQEASLIKDIDIFAVKDLKEAIWHLRGFQLIHKTDSLENYKLETKPLVDISEIKGQAHAKKALEISAAGGHNLLLYGPPGAGKTMLAKALSGILPKLSFEESLEVTKVYSVSRLLKDKNVFLNNRPVRSPHHTISYSALIGGGIYPRPGEISLAHRGVLFLDEFPEFSNQALESLRQPLEDKIVTISRVNASLTFPANFVLVAAMNPCRCGYKDDLTNKCKCSIVEIRNYHKKLSGPIVDRIDLQVHVPKVDNSALFENEPIETSYDVKKRVEAARNIQIERYKDLGIYSNSDLPSAMFDKYLNMTSSAKEKIIVYSERKSLSARATYKLLKVARTIADLDQSSEVEEFHITQAASLRTSIG